MALRVLLADESTTIKKVIELTLQDYAVEVKSVNVGTDVVPVATEFQPDLIFVDVLLPKKNGYEICREIKSAPNLAKVPLILMWSGFMQIDESLLEGCMPQARLEKPFETEQLRSLVKELVDKTKSQEIGEFLDFPEMPEFEEPNLPPPVSAEPEPSRNETQLISLDENWGDTDSAGADMPEGIFEEEDEFSKVNLQDLDTGKPQDAMPEGIGDWQVDESSAGVDEFSATDLQEIDLDADMGELELGDDALPPPPQSMEPEIPSPPPMAPPQAPPMDPPQMESPEIKRGGTIDIDDEVVELSLSGTEIDDLEPEEHTLSSVDKYRLDDVSDDDELNIDLAMGGDIGDDAFLTSEAELRETDQQIDQSIKEHLTASLDYKKIEEIVRAHIQPSVENAVWKILPEIAEKVLSQEINRILREVEKDYEGRP